METPSQTTSNDNVTDTRRTTTDDVIEEARSLPVGAGVELYACHGVVDLGTGVEGAVPQSPGVLLHLGGDQQDVARLKEAVLQTQHSLGSTDRDIYRLWNGKCLL